MTKTGWVFLVFNILAAGAFIYFAAPYPGYRLKMWKAIEKANADSADLAIKIEAAERERGKLIREITLFNGLTNQEATRAAVRQAELETQLAYLAEQQEDAKFRVQELGDSLQAVRDDIDARQQEVNRLTMEVGVAEARKKELNGNIADLTAQLQKSQADYQAAMDRAADLHKQYLDLVQQFPEIGQLAQLSE